MNFNKFFSYIFAIIVCSASIAEVIEEVRIEGRDLVPIEAITPYIEISIGQDVDEDAIRSQVKALYRSQLFQQVKVSIENQVLIIQLLEQPVIQSIEVTSSVMDASQAKKQLEELKLVAGELLIEKNLESWRIGAQASLQNSGFEFANVQVEIKPAEDNTVHINISVDEGSATKLRAITFSGSPVFSERLLLKQLNSGTTNIASFVINNDLYSEYGLEMDRKLLIKFYKDKGYRAPSITYDVSDVSPIQRMWKSSYKTSNFHIESGPLFHVTELEFSDDKDQWPDTLKELLQSELEGLVGDASIKQKAQGVLVRFFEGEGHSDYYKVQVKDRIIGYDKLKMTLSLDKEVNFVRFIHISGNVHTLDEPLRRALVVEEAKPFDDTMLKFSTYSLKGYSFIKDAKIKKVAVGDNLYDIFVEITEAASSFTAEMQGSFATGTPFGAKVSTAEQNFLGTGNSMELSLNATAAQQQLSLNYSQPWFNVKGHQLSTGITFSRQSKETEKTTAYQSNAISLATSYSLPVTTNFFASLGGAYIYNNYQNIGVASKLVRDYFENKDNTIIEQFKVLGGLSYKQIDSAYMPTKGLRASFNAVAALPVADAASYYQLNLSMKGYYPVAEMFDQPVVLKGKFLGSYGENYQDGNADMPFFARYNAGGIGTVRGYAPGSLGPVYEDQIYEKDEEGQFTDIVKQKIDKPKGGNKLFAVTAELQLPSPMPDLAIPSLFVDAGNVFDDKDSLDLSELRGAIGASVLLKLPVGDITVSAALPFNHNDDDSFSTISFGMGAMF